MEGYERTPEMTEELIAAIRDALYRFPSQRLGQLLINKTGKTDIFHVYDEDIIAVLHVPSYLKPKTGA